MLLAAVLFLFGWVLDWFYTMLIMIATSAAILVCALIAFGFGPGLDMLHVLLIVGYLTAHQSGYLLGAYCGGLQDEKRRKRSPLP